MQPQTKKAIFSYGIATLLILLIAVNVVLFLRMRGGKDWDFVEKNDGTVLFGHAELLAGGFLKVSELYNLSYTEHLQGVSESSQFKLESLNPQTVQVQKLAGPNEIVLSAAEVKQWGPLPKNSEVVRQLNRLSK